MKRCLLTDHYRNDSLDPIHFHATVTDNIGKDVESGTPWHRRWDLKSALCKVLGCPTGSHTVGGCPGRSIFLIYAKNENICQQKLTDECSQQYSHSSQHVETAQCPQVINEKQNVVRMEEDSTTGHSVSITTTVRGEEKVKRYC